MSDKLPAALPTFFMLTVSKNLISFEKVIKHHRIPTTLLSFEQPNLPALIREIEELIPTL